MRRRNLCCVRIALDAKCAQTPGSRNQRSDQHKILPKPVRQRKLWMTIGFVMEIMDGRMTRRLRMIAQVALRCHYQSCYQLRCLRVKMMTGCVLEQRSLIVKTMVGCVRRRMMLTWIARMNCGGGAMAIERRAPTTQNKTSGGTRDR